MALYESGEQVESVLRRLLPRQGYKLLNNPRKQGETGADVIARKGDVQVFIECIGYQENAPLRSKQFFEGFFCKSGLKQPFNNAVRVLLGFRNKVILK